MLRFEYSRLPMYGQVVVEKREVLPRGFEPQSEMTDHAGAEAAYLSTPTVA